MAVEAVPKEVGVVPQAETARKAKNVRKEVVVVPREAEAIAHLEAEVAPQVEVIAAGSPTVPGPMARFVEVLFLLCGKSGKFANFQLVYPKTARDSFRAFLSAFFPNSPNNRLTRHLVRPVR
jgi:hypothetical protein